MRCERERARARETALCKCDLRQRVRIARRNSLLHIPSLPSLPLPRSRLRPRSSHLTVDADLARATLAPLAPIPDVLPSLRGGAEQAQRERTGGSEGSGGVEGETVGEGNDRERRREGAR
eukprot:1632523-Rhodomonas_salina.2